MKRREFLEIFKRHRKVGLREAYAGDPHGPASIAMSLLDLDKDAERVWGKYRSTLLGTTPAELEALLDGKRESLESAARILAGAER